MIYYEVRTKNNITAILLYTKKIIIICSVIFLLIARTTILKNKTSHSFDNKIFSSYASISENRKELWNKMKISSAVISERITGTSFNSGTESNMNGIDVSAKDEYVKTRDSVFYTIELNIDANTEMPGVTDASEFPGGVITGDESVYYGDDSTKDYIVIKPDKGFEVTQIFIKGEEIDVETCRKGCVLGNFKNVIEDKEIVVTFVKVEVNPDTAITISITFIIGLITMLGSILYIRKGYKKEVKI